MLRRLPLAAVTLVLLAPAAADAQTLRIDEGDDGRTRSVAGTGSTVRIVLEQNASTGAVWRFTRRPARSILRYSSAIFTPPPEADPGEPQIAGAPGTKTYTYRTRARGTTTLSLALVGPDGEEVLDRLSVTVRVT